MARPDSFDGLSEFLAIVRRGGFRAAALELGVTPGAVSQAVQALERRLGLPVFHRTTRKVTLTEAGEKLFQRLDPAAETITSLLDELIQMRARPSGTLRLLVHRIALRHVVEPVLPQFREAWPRREGRDHDRRHARRACRRWLRCRHPHRRVYRPRHDRGAGLPDLQLDRRGSPGLFCAGAAGR